jgi:hypothetical protein
MEHAVIDMLIDVGTRKAGEVDKATVHSLYTKGLIYIDVPVYDEDYIISTRPTIIRPGSANLARWTKSAWCENNSSAVGRVCHESSDRRLL